MDVSNMTKREFSNLVVIIGMQRKGLDQDWHFEDKNGVFRSYCQYLIISL